LGGGRVYINNQLSANIVGETRPDNSRLSSRV